MDGDNLPSTFEIDSQVIMDKNISESSNGPPVNFGMPGLEVIADALGGFGQGLEIAQDGVLNQFRLAKSSLAVLALLVYAPNTIEDVMDVEAVVLHNGIASRRTRSRING